MRFRLFSKKRNHYICDCEYYINNKGDIVYEYLYDDGTIRYIGCGLDYEVQCSTGLKDVNGKEIFEGDWVEWEEIGGYGIAGAADITRRAQVVFSPSVAAFVLDVNGRHLFDDKYGDYQHMYRSKNYKITKQ